MWLQWGYRGLCGAALLVVLAGPGSAQEGTTVEDAANTFAGILAKPDAPDPRACLPGGGLSLLGVKYADVGMKGIQRLRTDHPVRIRERESYEKVQKQGAALAPVADKVKGLDSDIAFLQKEIPDKSKRIEELERQLAREEAGPGTGSKDTPEQAKDRAERIVKLKAEIADEKGKLAQMRGKLSAAESEVGPARLEQAKLEQAYKAAKATNNADYAAADATGNSCP